MNLIYNLNELIFYKILRMNEVPLWADKIRWFFERLFPYKDE